ncbi:MAG: dipeptidase [Eubacteriales bacterium]
MKYFDLHCDTAYEMYNRKQTLGTNALSVSLDGFDVYERKAEVFAVWSENTKSPGDVYGDFFNIFDYLKEEIGKNADRALLCTDAPTLCADDSRLKIIPAVEGSRLIEKDIFRLEILRELGVRVLTLAWGGLCPACGAYDTDVGLTDFGYQVVEMCEKLGIILDVSHLSEKGFWDLANVAKKPFIASHSNAQTVCNHPRNLSDTQLRTVISHGGIAGVNLVGKHLSKTFADCPDPDPEAVLETVVKHILHFMEKGSGKNICLGCDLDGTEPLAGLEKVSDIGKVANYMKKHGADEMLTEDVFYNNAFAFFAKNL